MQNLDLPSSDTMTTDAAAPSALSRLKIDRSVQAKTGRPSALLPWLIAGGVGLAAAGAWALYPRTADRKSVV